MVVSLVNPHDVLLYPKTYTSGGYDSTWLEGEIEPPGTVNEDLSTKPSVQAEFLKLFNASGPIPTRQMKRNYLNFYGNLMKSSDAFLVQLLDTLERTGLLNDTLVIATADHGEMGTAHGGMRQKNFNVYEESTHVPLVYSNPRLFPRARSSQALVSHVDFLPTLASLVGAPSSARTDWEGRDYSDIVLGRSSKGVQDYTVFTYDDYQSGQPKGPYPKAPNHIVSIRERNWKIARYYDVTGKEPDQWELYHLATDPFERVNLAYKDHKRTPAQQRAYTRLRRKLAAGRGDAAAAAAVLTRLGVPATSRAPPTSSSFPAAWRTAPRPSSRRRARPSRRSTCRCRAAPGCSARRRGCVSTTARGRAHDGYLTPPAALPGRTIGP